VPLSTSQWIASYRAAWINADASAAASLFTEDGIYCWHPLQPPARGRDGVRSYWEDVTATQSEVAVRFGNDISSGSGHTAVEFWTLMKDRGEEVTVYGAMLLAFDADGLCVELREYWLTEPGWHEPPGNWGR
jgi:ketosteroid isomerase-like protein